MDTNSTPQPAATVLGASASSPATPQPAATVLGASAASPATPQPAATVLGASAASPATPQPAATVLGASASSPATTRLTLRQLLGGELTLVIPDMQRDYCWGLRTDPDEPDDKVSILVSGLVYLYVKRRLTPLGLLYGYEDPVGSGHILIIDGQQRLTTLYLLLGMLFRRTSDPALRRLLISDYELIDDRQPRLLYQVRNEAMYFMSDLVTNFFLNRDGRLSEIEGSHWYFRSYDSDPTIQSVLGALRRIDDVLERASRQEGWDFADFTDFITDRLEFMYHDLGDARRAQKMFITINTTGEPLTLPQNYKSLLVAIAPSPEQAIAQWEDMEHWAWLHRDKTDPDRPHTSDAVLEQLMRIWIAYRGDDNMTGLNPKHFSGLYDFFGYYRQLIDYVPDAIGCRADSQADMFRLLPCIEYIRHWHPSAGDEIVSLWSFLGNILRYTRVSASGSDTQAAINMVRNMPSQALTSLTAASGISDKVLNPDSKCELTILDQHADEHGRAASLIARAQSHPMLNGRIRTIASWCTDKGGHIDLDRFDEFTSYIYDIWGSDIDERPELDHLRRALLTLRHPGYPIVRRGDSVLSLCWKDYDWQRLMLTSSGLVRMLIDRVRSSSIPPLDTLKRMTNKFDDRTSPYYFIIKSPTLLSRCRHRRLLRPYPVFTGFYLHDDDSSTYTMQWFVDQLPLKIDLDRWSTMRAYGTRCLYTDHRYYDLSVDLYYTPGQKFSYRIELFSRNEDGERRSQCNPAEIARSLNIPVSYDKKRKRHYTLVRDTRAAAAIIDKICCKP